MSAWGRHVAAVAVVIVTVGIGAYFVGRSYGVFFAFAFSLVGGSAVALPLGARASWRRAP